MVKRVYGTADYGAVEGGFGVLLDGRLAKTPAGRPLCLSTEALAAGVAAEWQAQGEEMRPETMALTRFAATAIDGVADHRDAVIAEIAAFAATDLLCHRADGPASLVERQEAAWQPLLDWLGETHGAKLSVTTGIVAREQPADALAAVRAVVAAFDDFSLAPLSTLTSVCGSLVIALALAAGRIDADEAWRTSRIDEDFQIEKWGEDSEAAARAAVLRADVAAAARFLELCRGG